MKMELSELHQQVQNIKLNNPEFDLFVDDEFEVKNKGYQLQENSAETYHHQISETILF